MSDKAKRITGGGCLVAFALFVAAILFPVFQKVREGHHGSCQSNLKQLGLALVQYSQDNDEALPNVASRNALINWRSAIYPYTYKSERFYQCPQRHEDKPCEVGGDGFCQDYAANYSGNYGQTQPDQGEGAFAGPGSKPLGLADFDHPATTIALVEVEDNDWPEFDIDSLMPFRPAAGTLWAGHKGGTNYAEGGSNYLFVDGSVKWLPPLKTYATDSSGKVTVNLWYRDGSKPLSANGIAVLKAAQERFGVQ